MLDLIPKIPAYKIFYRTGVPVMLPSSLAISVTNRCNCRCRICKVYNKKHDELSLDEYKKIFKSLSGSVKWATITGGEPFMRADLFEITDALITMVRPEAVTLATNGFFTDRTVNFANHFLANHSKSKLVINISFDAIGTSHDKLRKLDGLFDKARETFYALKALPNKTRLHVGINTVISKYNMDSVHALKEYIANFEPDTHIFEPAQPRVELCSEQLDIEPDVEKLSKFLTTVIKNGTGSNDGFLPEMISRFRKEYYKLCIETAREKNQVIPCYAGIVSGHISTNGNVWSCCTLGRSMGNLRDYAYNFEKVWGTKEATQLRRFIRDKCCYCSLANAGYTNMIMSSKSLARIFADLSLKR